MTTSETLELSSSNISELLSEIDPRMTVHPKVEEFVLDLADEFLENVASFSAQLAKHRRSTVIESKDIQLCLKKNWDIHVHGVSNDPSFNSLKRKDHPKLIKGKGSVHSQRLDSKRQILHKAARSAASSSKVSGARSSGSAKRVKRSKKLPSV